MTIREYADGDDVEGLCRCLAVFAPCCSPAFACASLARRKANGIVTFVAIDDGKVVGTASAIVEEKLIHDGGKVGHVEDVAVLPGMRGKGLGKEIVGKLLAHLGSVGCYKAVLHCDEAKAGFYEAIGFHRNGESMRIDL